MDIIIDIIKGTQLVFFILGDIALIAESSLYIVYSSKSEFISIERQQLMTLLVIKLFMVSLAATGVLLIWRK